jgi:hypothetical protein
MSAYLKSYVVHRAPVQVADDKVLTPDEFIGQNIDLTVAGKTITLPSVKSVEGGECVVFSTLGGLVAVPEGTQLYLLGKDMSSTGIGVPANGVVRITSDGDIYTAKLYISA